MIPIVLGSIGLLFFVAGVLLLVVSSPSYQLVFSMSSALLLASAGCFALPARESTGVRRVALWVMSTAAFLFFLFAVGLLVTAV